MQVYPGVYLVNGLAYGRHQNSYLIRTAEAAVMVDSGDLDVPVFDEMPGHLALWGLSLDDVTHLLLTHSHFDHASHAARLQRAGAQLVGNAECAAALAAGDDRCIGYSVRREFEPCQIDIVVEDGQTIEVGDLAVHCIHAPGHAKSCTIYEIERDGKRLWFVGDVIVTGTGALDASTGWNGGPDYDRAVYLETLRRLSHMPCDTLFPGHGPARVVGGRGLVQIAYARAMSEWR